MFKRQTSGSVVCASCGYLVGVKDATCYHCGRRYPGLWGFAPALRNLGHDLGFVPFVTGFCIVMYVASLMLSGGGIRMGGMLSFLGPTPGARIFLGASGSIPVFELHRWWTVLSAGYLHGGLLHLVFSLMWIRQLAPLVGELYGPGRMVIIYTAGAAVGFALSSVAGQTLGWLPMPMILHGGQHTVGASAPIFGLLGGLVYYGRRGSSLIGNQAWSWAIPNFLLGFILPGIDNYAHVGGFLGGFLAGKVLNPLKPERVNHMLGAVICLAASIAAVVASIISSLMFG